MCASVDRWIGVLQSQTPARIAERPPRLPVLRFDEDQANRMLGSLAEQGRMGLDLAAGPPRQLVIELPPGEWCHNARNVPSDEPAD